MSNFPMKTCDMERKIKYGLCTLKTIANRNSPWGILDIELTRKRTKVNHVTRTKEKHGRMMAHQIYSINKKIRKDEKENLELKSKIKIKNSLRA